MSSTSQSNGSSKPRQRAPLAAMNGLKQKNGNANSTTHGMISSANTSPALAALTPPALLTILLLIFGGCCSNVYTLESILTLSPNTGTLITCLQFLLITLYKLPGQITLSEKTGLPTLRSRSVPVKKWALFALQFAAINTLNNAAFAYSISLPLHIILRSAGPVASMLVGYVWRGKRYARIQVLGVVCLFVGVVTAALSDAGAKPAKSDVASGVEVKKSENSAGTAALPHQAPGFVLLTLALLLSAVMGVWADGLYERYGRHQGMVDEQLFYCHALSLPLFFAQAGSLNQQYAAVMEAAARSASTSATLVSGKSSVTALLVQSLPLPVTDILLKVPLPLALLLLNAITQIACISGVNALSTQTSSLTVSIVLNVRKLASLLISIVVFGNVLSWGVIVGASLVVYGAGLYSLGSGVGSKDVQKAKKDS